MAPGLPSRADKQRAKDHTVESENRETASRYRRRREAADFLTERGFKVSTATLAKLVVSGDGPTYRVFGRFPLYLDEDLLSWAEKRCSRPVRSTGELRR